MSAENTKYDDTLFTMAKQSGGVQEFLNNIGSFLRRRTDFFTQTPNNEWEAQLLEIFHKEQEKLGNSKKLDTFNNSKRIDNNEIKQETDAKQLKPNEGKGCDLTNYAWTQTLKEIELKIPINCQRNLRARDIDIEISKKFLKVGLKGQTPIVSGELSKEIKYNESTWMLDNDDNSVNITLEKVKKTLWWNRLMLTDPVISLNEIEPEKVKLSDLDANKRECVEKMLRNQRDKQMAIEQTPKIEGKKMEIFEKFKQEHPELNFSKCKFNQ